VTGIVKEELSESPLMGAMVYGDPTVDPVLTGVDGSFLIYVKPGTLILKVVLEGYETCEEKIDVKDNLTVDVILKFPSTDPNGNGCEPTLIIGSVTDAKTQLPIETVLVNTTRERNRTGEDGSYTLNIEVGSYVVTASKEGYRKESATIDVLEEEQSYRLDFVLTPVPTLTLTLGQDTLYLEQSKVLKITASAKKTDATPVSDVTVTFDYFNILTMKSDYPEGEFDSQIAVTDIHGKATVEWTCFEDLSGQCGRGHPWVVITASAH
jgi:hypothetical protein